LLARTPKNKGRKERVTNFWRTTHECWGGDKKKGWLKSTGGRDAGKGELDSHKAKQKKEGGGTIGR